MSDKIQAYQDARALGLSHETALEVAHISRAVDYAAHVSSGMAKGNAAKAAGYSRLPDGETKALGVAALKMQEATKALGATPWLCPKTYRDERERLEQSIRDRQAKCEDLRRREDACMALALAQCRSEIDSSGSEPGYPIED